MNPALMQFSLPAELLLNRIRRQAILQSFILFDPDLLLPSPIINPQ